MWSKHRPLVTVWENDAASTVSEAATTYSVALTFRVDLMGPVGAVETLSAFRDGAPVSFNAEADAESDLLKRSPNSVGRLNLTKGANPGTSCPCAWFK